MKLHWSPRSPFVRKVMVAAHELGLAERITTIRTVAAMNTPNAALLADNPLSKIPTLVLESGEVLYDSLTICEYLDHLAGGGRLFPQAGPARWQALTWQSLGNGFLDALILWRNEREKPAERQTQAWMDAFAVKTEKTLERLEGQTAALDATPFNIGHVTIGCALSYLDFRFADLDWRAGHPKLAAWHAATRARPSFQATDAVDG
jgi:glutathione S-transferase